MLNVKTYHTYLQSTIKVKDYVKFIKDNGLNSAPVCDISSCSSFYELQSECNKHGAKPVFGVQVNVCLDATKKPDKKTSMLSDNSASTEYAEAGDLRIWALNNEGLKNLYKISSYGWREEYFYYAPRVDLDFILDNSDGLMISTGSFYSWINKNISNPLKAKQLVQKIYDKIGSRFVVELLTEKSFASHVVNNFYKAIASDIPDAKFVPSAEIYYLKESDKRAHCVVSAIKRVSKGGSKSGAQDIDGAGVKSATSAQSFIDRCKEGFSLSKDFENFNYYESFDALSDLFEAEIEFNPNKMVIPDIGVEDPDAELASLARSKMLEFDFAEDKKYQERLERELQSLKNLKFSSYILYIKTILDMARELNIPYGPGRGSAAGSLVNYVLGNTNIDPMKYDLLFERYIDPQRVSPPDNDIDFPPSRVPELINAIRERWGHNSVAYICSFSEIGPKVAIADCCRIHGVSVVSTRKLASMVDAKDEDMPGLESSDAKAILSKYKGLKEDIKSILGLYRQTGIHAAGLLCADNHINEYIPTHSVSDENGRSICSSFDMAAVEQLGLLKVDILKLVAIDILQDCQELIRKNNDPKFDINKIDYEDKKTLNLFKQGEFDGIFQFDSSVVRSFCNKFKDPFNNFEFLAHVTSLIRPGPMDSGQADQYVERYNKNQHGYKNVEYHPIVSDITSTTLGVMIYQEQVSRVFGELSHHENPDRMRRLIAKSKGVEELEVNRVEFVDGCLNNNEDITQQVSNKLFDDIATFGRYGFNKSHAISYSGITAQFQWLKAHYPLYFWYALIKHSGVDKRRSFAIKAKEFGVGVSGIDVNSSDFDMSIDIESNNIVEGFSGVVGIQEKTASKIIENRPYRNAAELMLKLGASLTKTLVRCGACKQIVKNDKYVVDNVEELLHRVKLKRDQLNAQNLQQLIDDNESYEDYSDYQKRVAATLINRSSIDNPFVEQTEKACKFIVDSFNEFEATKKQLAPTLLSYKSIWMRGYISDIKEIPHNPAYKREPTAKEMEHESFGKPECRCTITTENGGRFAIKIPWDQYGQHKLQEGAYVLVACMFGFNGSLSASCVIDLSHLDRDNNVHLSAFKHNPIIKILKDNPSAFGQDAKIALQNVQSIMHNARNNGAQSFRIYGVVASKKSKITSKDTLKLDMSILCPGGYVPNVTAFERTINGYSAGDFQESKIGSIVRCDVKRNLFRNQESYVIQDDSFFLYR